jgi:hypothetical protein
MAAHYIYKLKKIDMKRVDNIILEKTGEEVFISQMVNTTWAELKAMRDNGELIAGMQYRITDYECTTTQKNTQSAGHVFDIIVTADSGSVLNENARAILHDGDEYFATCDLAAWELKYCLDNDKSRFDWVNEQGGKGVIYYMKDEWSNECPYDFKNVLYDGSKYTFGGSSGDDSLHGNSYGNVIKEYRDGNTMFLTNNIFGTSCYYNTIGYDSVNNIFGNDCCYNTIGYGSYYITFGYGCEGNTLGNYCYIIKFGYECLNNIIGNACHDNTFGYDCNNNTFGNYCWGNTFGNACSKNACANYFFSNTIKDRCDHNTFGNYIRYSALGNDCSSNTFGNGCNFDLGNNCSYNTFGNGSYAMTFKMDFFCYNIIDNDVFEVSASYSTEESQQLKYIHVLSGTKNIELTGLTVGATYPQKCGFNSQGQYVVKNELD